jgi:hypothetical protein
MIGDRYYDGWEREAIFMRLAEPIDCFVVKMECYFRMSLDMQ